MGLNYIWDLVIKAKQAGIDPSQITFKPAEVYSPYMELSQQDLNGGVIPNVVEVNPYYRFYDIFRDLFDINVTEDVELRYTLFDIVIHFLADLDLMQGMNKREYYISFVLLDIESGLYGTAVKNWMSLFTKEEQEMIAEGILRMYDTGESLQLLKSVVRSIFPRSTIYVNREEKDEMLFFIGRKQSERSSGKLQLLMTLFLPVRFQTQVYWDCHFGIIEAENTMIQDHIAMY
ncbi:iron-dependent peroxidase [Paenibacillus turicensis]|uniref:iron-dependent peroxidase n=1 Tax=Paenibacillus turicensis TaxID=160487 RepID=UPI001AE142EF|nr:iron-dependent peroxidase [Paenibacillus turicensis]